MKTKLCKHNQKEVESVHYVKVYAKDVLRNGSVYAEASATNLLYQLRSRPLTHQRDLKIHPRYFTFAHCLISAPLYAMFRALAFWCFYFQIILILFCLGRNVHLIYYQQTSHTNLKKSWFWGSVLEPFLENRFDFGNFTTSRERIEFEREITKLRIWSRQDISAIF